MNIPPKYILITGASGFLGFHLLSDLRWNEYKLILLTRNINRISSGSNRHIIEGDLFSLHTHSDLLAKTNFIIHMAGEKKDEKLMQKVNVGGMDELLSIQRDFPGIKIMYISSSGVYGIKKHSDLILTEMSKCFPDIEYERTKYEAEQHLISYADSHPLQFLILRPSNVFGEEDQSLKLLTLIKRIHEGRQYTGDKFAMVNYVYVKYLTEVIFQIIKSEKFNNSIYNINTPVRLTSFIGLIANELKIDAKIKVIPRYILNLISELNYLIPFRFRFLDRDRYFALTNKKIYSTAMIDELLGIDKNKYLEEGIHQLVSFYKSKGLL